MSDEHDQRLKEEADPRRVYGAGETPDDIAELFARGIERLAKGEGSDSEQ